MGQDIVERGENVVRKVYFGLSVLMLVTVVAQFYLAAVGAFNKPQTDSSYLLHQITGSTVLPLLSILATIAAAIARAPRRLIGQTILPLGLIVLQFAIIAIGKALGNGTDQTTPLALIVLGLHAVNGLAILGVAGTVLRGARQLAFGSPGLVDSAATAGSGSRTA
jgi:Family of unknown function (DUF6220)